MDSSNWRMGWRTRVSSTSVATTGSWPIWRICLDSSWGSRRFRLPPVMETTLLICSIRRLWSVWIPIMDIVVCCSLAMLPIWEWEINFKVIKRQYAIYDLEQVKPPMSAGHQRMGHAPWTGYKLMLAGSTMQPLALRPLAACIYYGPTDQTAHHIILKVELRRYFTLIIFREIAQRVHANPSNDNFRPHGKH